MKLFDLMALHDAAVTPLATTLHLASHNGSDHPLDVYKRGRFEQWQAIQSNKNFSRPFIVGLVPLPERDTWLFTGAYRSLGIDQRPSERTDGNYRYRTEELATLRSLGGRLVVTHRREARPCYRKAETLADRIEVAEIKRRPLTVDEFTGFRTASLRRADLEVVVQRSVESWRAALSSVKGVYVIADTETGKLYVGKADGEFNIWGRWCAYAQTGHGGNKQLVALLKEHPERLHALRYSVLEVMDVRSKDDDIFERESYWKRILLTTEFGLNDN